MCSSSWDSVSENTSPPSVRRAHSQKNAVRLRLNPLMSEPRARHLDNFAVLQFPLNAVILPGHSGKFLGGEQGWNRSHPVKYTEAFSSQLDALLLTQLGAAELVTQACRAPGLVYKAVASTLVYPRKEDSPEGDAMAEIAATGVSLG